MTTIPATRSLAIHHTIVNSEHILFVITNTCVWKGIEMDWEKDEATAIEWDDAPFHRVEWEREATGWMCQADNEEFLRDNVCLCACDCSTRRVT